MRFTQCCANPSPRSEPPPTTSFAWAVDFDALHLWCESAGGEPLDETFGSLADLERRYRERVAPLFMPDRCVDLDRGDRAAPVSDLAAFERELRACGHDWEEAPLVDEPGEVVVAGVVTLLRRELNRALGPGDRTLDDVVLVVGDATIRPAFKDPPAIAGLDEAALERVIDGGDSLRWARGERLDFSLSHEGLPVGELESLIPDPGQYGPDGILGAVLYLAAARLEAAPRLRASVAVPRALRVLVTFEEAPWVDHERRALARAHAGTPARACIETWARGA